MKHILKITALLFIMVCVLLAVGCKKEEYIDEGPPIGMPSEGIINSDGEYKEDEISVDEFFSDDKTDNTTKDESKPDKDDKNESNKNDSSDKNNSSDKTDSNQSKPDDDNEDDTSSTDKEDNTSSDKNESTTSDKKDSQGFYNDRWY